MKQNLTIHSKTAPHTPHTPLNPTHNQIKYHQYIAVDFWPMTALRFMLQLQTN